MKHFITFQKRKALHLPKPTTGNVTGAYRIQTELLKYGFVLSKEAFERLKGQNDYVLNDVYADICRGLREIVGTDGYEPIYRNFPQSVRNLSYEDFVINAITHYWSFGMWRPDDEGYLNRELKLEPSKIDEIGLLTDAGFDAIFTDIVYSGSSISKWDKHIVDWFIDSGLAPELEFNRISFKETKAYIGKRYLDSGKTLPVKSATDILRIYAAYCGGDEGLKDVSKFVQPKKAVKRILLESLNGCYDLEESFKTYREVWLRVLFYLNPGTVYNSEKYPEVSKYARLLRNHPKKLRTFNSYLEQALREKDPGIFELLKKRRGVFMRRMNEIFGIFGMQAIDKFLELNPKMDQLAVLYNYFSDRAQSKDRAVVLANQNRSNVSTFEALEALHPDTVEKIQTVLLDAIQRRVPASNKKLFIDRSLFYRPLAVNNRSSSFAISGKAVGTVEKLPEGKTLRAYVHWVRTRDIDLSAFIIMQENSVVKVGWNGSHIFKNNVVYSGDNTGYSERNAEYIDCNLDSMADVEWIVFDARVFRGPTFKNWGGDGVHAGWMMREYPEANRQWLPETIEHAIKLQSDSNNAYLMAIHVPTRNLVYLDVALNTDNIVANNDDAIKLRMFLEKFIILDTGEIDIDWKKIAQGHILSFFGNAVNTKEGADIVFDENTTWETVSRVLNNECL